MSLTPELMDWLDEQPMRRRGGWIESFTGPGESSNGVGQFRSRRPAWQIAADARRRQLELYAYLIEKDDRDASP